MAQDPKSPSLTLNMPETSFPMRGDMPKREPEFLKFWRDSNLYEARLTQNESTGKRFSLADGPPYANGAIHHGHILNKILKDIVSKYQSMQGAVVKFTPGWDCHGLPIERAAAKDIKDFDKKSPTEIRSACRSYAQTWIDKQSSEFQRLGILADWEKPYRTMDFPYEARTAAVFGQMVREGLVYLGAKPVHWCPVDGTALAEAEVEYQPKQSSSIYVKFQVRSEDHAGLLSTIGHPTPSNGAPISVVIWTTTPWTLPANLAVSAHPEFDYVLISFPDALQPHYYAVAEGRLEAFIKEACAGSPFETVGKIAGKELEGILLDHPFAGRQVPIILGTHVTLDAGTGFVHTAPGHGHEDFQVGKVYNLGVLSPVNGKGIFTQDAGKYAGQHINQANAVIIDDLRQSGALVHESKIHHEYPHCWRCKNPIIFRTTPQWFASMDDRFDGSTRPSLRQTALEEIDKVRWIPHWGRERIYSMLENRPDWCLSRQRLWGVPIIAFYCDDCDAVHLDADLIEQIAGSFADKGCDHWWTEAVSSFLPAETACKKCGGKNFRKETDILDVWFDSGVYWYAVGESDPQIGMPVDLYLEGSDQHRGWFHSSLLTSTAVRGGAPYRQVLTHGFVCDDQGRKYSKSTPNYVPPNEIIQKHGAEVLRLWAAAEDFRDDMRFGPNILEKFIEAYKKIRNTFKHMIGCLADTQRDGRFDPRTDKVAYKELWAVDRWMLDRLGRYLTAVESAYAEYEFHRVFYETVNFFTVDLSARYLDIARDRLYTYRTTDADRRASQTVIYEIVTRVATALAPILSFTAEDVWQHLWKEVFGPIEADKTLGIKKSVHLMSYPMAEGDWALSQEALGRFAHLFAVRDLVNTALEAWRRELVEKNAPKGSGSSLAAQLEICVMAGSPEDDSLRESGVDLEEFLIVSKVHLRHSEEGEGWMKQADGRVSVRVLAAAGQKCPRCWRYAEDVRERENLVPSADDFPKAAKEGAISFAVCDRCAEELE